MRCEFNFIEDELVRRYCDNGDGTVTVFDQFMGSEAIIDLNGESFDSFIEGVDDEGFLCFD
ncbi:hypothetical protein GCM10009117_01960 [Gangjinia marincola]|uniref:Uncharacterized protein n=1 Tax=Gangjinia marincola TaxID=578463 RepID=A0ABP3XPA2_9FLAO